MEPEESDRQPPGGGLPLAGGGGSPPAPQASSPRRRRGPTDLGWLSGPASIWAWLLAGPGFATGYWLIAAVGKTALSQINPKFTVFASFIGAEAGVWVLITPILVETLIRLRQTYPSGRRAEPVLSFLLVASLVIAGPYVLRVQPHGRLIYPYRWVLPGTLIAGMIVALPAVVGIWSVLYILRGLDQELDEHAQSPWSPAHAEIVQAIQDLGSALRRFLICVAAEIGVMILAASALHNALAAKSEPGELPAEYVVLYGLLFTIGLALVYLPVHTALDRRGYRLVASQFPIPQDRQPDADWYSGRERLARLLRVGVPAGQDFQTAVAILAPLAASLLAGFLPKGAA